MHDFHPIEEQEMKKYNFTVFVLITLMLASCTPRIATLDLASSSQVDTTETTLNTSIDAQGRAATLLTAFFGLDNALPTIANFGICEGAAFKDGMPVIFSHQIDINTMQAGDFRVVTASGNVGKLTCVTLAPADDIGELRTALLVGDYGSISDPPVHVEIVGNLLSLDGSVNFKGAMLEVTPLERGPSMVWVEIVPESEWELGKAATALNFGGGNGCPVGTLQVVRATWEGGVTKAGGDEIDDLERQQYRVTLRQADGTDIHVVPFAIADLGDGDNNHELCLDVEGVPQSIFFPAGFVTDPREDVNPDSVINIKRY